MGKEKIYTQVYADNVVLIAEAYLEEWKNIWMLITSI